MLPNTTLSWKPSEMLAHPIDVVWGCLRRVCRTLAYSLRRGRLTLERCGATAVARSSHEHCDAAAPMFEDKRTPAYCRTTMLLIGWAMGQMQVFPDHPSP